MATIFLGKPVADQIATTLAERIARLARVPTLAIVSVGNRPDTAAFIAAKERFAARIGAHIDRRSFPESVSTDELAHTLETLSQDNMIDGIIVQLPLPSHLEVESLFARVVPSKDVDGLTAHNIKALVSGTPHVLPATARGIMNLLNAHGVVVRGARVVVVGRSVLVGKSVALTLLAQDATVTLCHRKTKHLSAITKEADILIVAAGSPGLIHAAHVCPGQVVIDVGITSIGEDVSGKKKLVGDVVVEEVLPLIAALSPVPGGVGPMTVSALFQNLVDAAEQPK